MGEAKEGKESQGKKETQTSFRPYKSSEEEEKQSSNFATRRDVFLMFFLAFISGGILILGILFFTGAITGDTVFDLSGEKEVKQEVSETPVIDAPLIVENLTNESVGTEPVVETVQEQPSDLCGEDILLTLGESTEYNDRVIILKLAGEFAAQISVGGQPSLVSVGETQEINHLNIYLADSNEADGTATIQVPC